MLLWIRVGEKQRRNDEKSLQALETVGKGYEAQYPAEMSGGMQHE
jgi:glycine betaine/proline transport system ATP-binding protein